MPELPDVEIFREYFMATALHQRIRGVEIRSPELLEGISEKRLKQKISGQAFSSATRHGKYLFAEVGMGCLVLHFGMTGFLKYFKNTASAPEYSRLLVEFANGYRLTYNCRRKLGRIGWTADREQFVKGKGLGPDPLNAEFNETAFQQLLEKRRGSIKGLLMNQQVLAGIGNIYSDEILFQAGIHPKRKVPELQDTEKKKIYDCLKEVLQIAIKRRVGKKGWPEKWLLPHRKPGKKCPHCGGEIRRLKVAGRSAYFCREHQR
jgi:formamidopyrimidine-DNA glycosylase